jgi:hypothetical protein
MGAFAEALEQPARRRNIKKYIGIIIRFFINGPVQMCMIVIATDNRITYLSRKKSLNGSFRLDVWRGLVGFHPVLDLGLSQTENVLRRIRRSLAAADVQEVQASGGLVQSFFVAGGIAKVTTGGLLDQGSGFGVVLLLANDLLHGITSFL